MAEWIVIFILIALQIGTWIFIRSTIKAFVAQFNRLAEFTKEVSRIANDRADLLNAMMGIKGDDKGQR